MFFTILNILAGTAAAAVYGLWAWKWSVRNCKLLAALNFMIAAIASVTAFAYALMLMAGDTNLLGTSLRPIVSIALIFPAVTRMLELRRDTQREAVARQLKRALREAAGARERP